MLSLEVLSESNSSEYEHKAWKLLLEVLTEREEEGFFDLRKDLLISFYREHRDIQEAMRLTTEAMVYLANIPDLKEYTQESE